MKKSMKLSVKPLWREIEKARNSAAAFLKSHQFSSESSYSFVMIVSELVENGIKYGHFSEAEDRVNLSVHINRSMITVEVVNPVNDETYKHLKNLDRTIQWIRGFQDPFEAYIDRLKEVSKKPLNDEESGLGLVRIAYEGQAILDFFVSDNGIVNVSAVSNFKGEDHGKK
jgi:hypothetical protein